MGKWAYNSNPAGLIPSWGAAPCTP
uniref:Uncharacterized protein n=1 Tax=Anguilla anguilla TaxID=7936 RepID=A0A0E9T5X5_ANGAN